MNDIEEKAPKSVYDLANELAEMKNTDVILYNGGIDRPHDNKFIKLFRGRICRENAHLYLITGGGNADAAYRISNCLQENYKHVSVIVPGFCKSAGTIICIGANLLIFNDLGEIGPLDVQLAKSDELWRTDSGLNLEMSLTVLKQKSLQMMEDIMISLTTKSGGRITTKTALQTACQLVDGLYGKIYAHIEPLQIGEVARSMQIAEEYGGRLNDRSKNLKAGALSELVAKYSTHGFVIDFKEASKLFTNVRKCTDLESSIAISLGDIAEMPISTTEPTIEFLSQQRRPKDADSKKGNISTGSSPAEGERT